jgi:hypothetical protein
MKQRKCGICREPAKHGNAVNAWCSHEHGAALAARLKAKADSKKARRERVESKVAKDAVKSTKELRIEAQVAFNAYIRARDAGKPCISCGRPDDGSHQRHASHYKPAGSNPALRYDEDNCHASCSVCNNYLSGNLLPYRENLIRKVGADCVDRLEGPQEPKKYTADDLRAIKKEYRAKARRLTKSEDVGR